MENKLLRDEQQLFIDGFNAAIEVMRNAIDNIEPAEIVCSVRCFNDIAEDLKAFFKDYVTEEMKFASNSMVIDNKSFCGDKC